MRKTILLFGLLIVIILTTGGCWPWEDSSLRQTPSPTDTPPKVEDAGHSSPSVEGRLLYARDGHIWLRSGTSANRLTEGIWATQPSWSPDGRKIAFVVRGEGYSDIWEMAADGSNPRQVTASRSDAAKGSHQFAHSSFWAFQPQWVPPDGEWIGYISHVHPYNLSSVMSAWIIRPDGTEEQQYWWMDRHIENPAWSPDGRIFAFTYFDHAKGAQLRYLDLNSGVWSPLGEDIDGIERYDPVWSPNGQWIAYAARQGGKTDLWLIPSPLNPLFDSNWSPVRLTRQGTARGPAWSPNGQQIAFIAEENDSFDLWLLKLDTASGQTPRPAEPEKLTNGAHIDATARPSWAP